MFYRLAATKTIIFRKTKNRYLSTNSSIPTLLDNGSYKNWLPTYYPLMVIVSTTILAGLGVAFFELGTKAKLVKHGHNNPHDGLDFGGRKDPLVVDPEIALKDYEEELALKEYEEELERQFLDSLN